MVARRKNMWQKLPQMQPSIYLIRFTFWLQNEKALIFYLVDEVGVSLVTVFISRTFLFLVRCNIFNRNHRDGAHFVRLCVGTVNRRCMFYFGYTHWTWTAEGTVIMASSGLWSLAITEHGGQIFVLELQNVLFVYVCVCLCACVVCKLQLPPFIKLVIQGHMQI